MPTKIKLILTFLVVSISAFIFYKHYILNQQVRSIMIALISIIMVFGMWIFPEATGKTKEKNEKK
ncbi:MAG: hypothetical protein CFH34_01582 [Alphaproteobacteria bacterium MarineAlpha9_Bin4]|nr:hypothetical protein [Pelagibacterales bacterium]PPR25102.1 MAG: hypothetical protein CFH34_01582 [Alphaproteobacteria bacterium MarineAlpha9_Bin4]|tara:strand:- start:1439 stop:1633 length:195 start_codon:yes stop_codon:yes gene_type:complete